MMKENKDVACYLVTKHSWKGKYKRIFSIGTKAVTTYSPGSMEITNQWAYNDVISIVPNAKSPGNLNEFTLTMKRGKKTDTMRFSTEQRSDLLTQALKFRNQFADGPADVLKCNAYKHHWSDQRIPVVLAVGECSLEQCDPATNKTLAVYDFKDIEGLILVSDYPGGFVVIAGGFGRLHLFASDRRDEIIKKITDNGVNYVGVLIRTRKDATVLEEFIENRFGKFSGDEDITSVTEFIVQKISARHMDSVKRIIAITETCLVERDPATYSITTCKPLAEISALIRHQENPQMFSVEYMRGQSRTYLSTDRDSLLASLLDRSRASGNGDVHVKMMPSNRGFRLGPFVLPVDEEVESIHLKFFQQFPAGINFSEVIHRFNANIAYSGLLHAVTQDGLFAENKERQISSALAALLEKEGDQTSISLEDLESQFQALRRLVASKAGFAAFTQLPKCRERIGIKVVKALKRNDDGVTHSAIDMICALMQPMHDNYDLRQEQLNKFSLLSSKKFLESLLDMFVQHIMRNTGALVVTAMLDFLTFALCAPYSETTDGTHFDQLLESVAEHGRVLYKLFQHPSLAVVKGAGLVLKAIIEEGSAEVAAKMQSLALAEGALPRHLLSAMFTKSTDTRLLTNRELSRHLVGLWVTGHPTAMGLLSRIMPAGLLAFLDSEEKVPDSENDRIRVRDNLKVAQDQFNNKQKNVHWRMIEKHVEHALEHWRARMGLEKKEDKLRERPIVLRKRRERIKSEANWKLFYYKFKQDHARPNLIWNFKTREELREALENEIRAFHTDKELGNNIIISWNHEEFEVIYHSLSDEIKIGDYYLRLLLEENEDSDENSYIKRSYEFFNDLYHRFLLATKVSMRCMCLQAMAIVYGRHHEDIGAFNDTKYIVNMLERGTDKMERDRLILFINQLINNTKNVKELMDASGIKILVDLLTLAHLHTSRATVPTQMNVLEASPDMMKNSEKEWYYDNGGKERLGPYSFSEMKDFWQEGLIHPKTQCWAQGMDGWRPLQAIPQLKWCLLASGLPIMNESDLATLILKMLIKICDYYPSRDVDGAIVRPLPKAQRLLSEPACLPHIVQLLLTFDPILVEKVSVLLNTVMQDNPGISRVYLTGIFYFILMYNGSNVLPIGRFLQLTHLKQAFRSDENLGTDIMVRSILGQILPEAMICYLENYGAEKFAEIFLGDFDTPEVIWNNEMRRMMIQKLAAHVGDFSPRLQSNTRALYQYFAIPVINYPLLENELFCNIYYLRHLCDVQQFPDWPIKEPIQFLKDILESWKKEVEKKPSSMSIEDAIQVLGLDPKSQIEDIAVRKAYFRLAQKYHPDKNPEGREMFEKVSKAYEFLCSRSCRSTDGPDPQNVILILKAQSILFSRYQEDLHPYKYAGYPMLIKTIQLETIDDHLFSKKVPLQAAASELAYHTVNCSALNAEELRRERGLEVLQEAFMRCVSVLSKSSKIDDMAVQVCIYVTKCYSVAAQFAACLEKFTEMTQMIKNVCRILYYKHLTKLCVSAAECVSSFAVDSILQMHLLQAGALWHLLLFLFNYDFTLDEGGVEKSEESNQQAIANQLAKLSLKALARLGGFLPKEATPESVEIKRSLTAMLTCYVTKQLSKCTLEEMLKLLNSNTENPYLIWDNSTRIELIEFLKDQQISIVRSGECDPQFGANFVFSMHQKELIIGDIFVRIYNEQPTFPIEDAKGFTVELLDYLGSQAQYLHSLMSLKESNGDTTMSVERLTWVQMSLEALANVVKNHPGVEIQCIGHFKLLFSMLRLEGCGKVQQLVLEVIAAVTSNCECVNDIAASEVLVYLLLASQTVPSSCLLTIEILQSLMSNTKLVKEALNKGAVVYLLDLFCNSTDCQVREKTAELLAKMCSDKLMGPRMRLMLTKFLPSIFMDAMRDSPESSVHMFEGVHENPELIWNSDAREKVSDVVKHLKNSHYKSQRDDIASVWKLPEDFGVAYEDTQGELIIGGVYLRLFIANPGWILRRPKEFLSELLDTVLDILNKDKHNTEMIETVSKATVCLLQAQPALGDNVPSFGHIPRLFQTMAAKKEVAARPTLLIVRQLTGSNIAVQAMAQTDCMGPVQVAMKTRSDMIDIACEAINSMIQKGHEELVQQVLNSEMVPYLLGLLGGKLEIVENPAGTKAQIVKALKAMTLSLQFGEQISNILEKSQVWSEYKDQKHDLFISNKNVAGYLAAGSMPGVAGYLTQGTSRSMPNVPPPMEDSSRSLSTNGP